MHARANMFMVSFPSCVLFLILRMFSSSVLFLRLLSAATSEAGSVPNFGVSMRVYFRVVFIFRIFDVRKFEAAPKRDEVRRVGSK